MAADERAELLNSQDIEGGQASESEPDAGEGDTENAVEHESRPSCIFIFFRLHSFVGTFSLFLMAMAQGFPSPHEKVWLISGLQEFYILLACALGAITELELSQWLIDRVAPILNDWLARGSFYLFLAVIATEQSTVDVDDSKIEDQNEISGKLFTALLLNIAAVGLVFTGILYLVMGLFCMKGLKERCENENDERLRRILETQRSNR